MRHTWKEACLAWVSEHVPRVKEAQPSYVWLLRMQGDGMGEAIEEEFREQTSQWL